MCVFIAGLAVRKGRVARMRNEVTYPIIPQSRKHSVITLGKYKPLYLETAYRSAQRECNEYGKIVLYQHYSPS